MKKETLAEIKKSYKSLQDSLEDEIVKAPLFDIQLSQPVKTNLVGESDISVPYIPPKQLPTPPGGNTKGIIEMMINNMAEIREYYVISKSQATESFLFAVYMSILGFIIIIGAIFSYLYLRTDLPVAAITALSGAIVEFVSATALYIYRKTIEQMNLYYNSLHQNERFLSAVHLAGKMSSSKRDDAYLAIINAQCKDLSAAFTMSGETEKKPAAGNADSNPNAAPGAKTDGSAKLQTNASAT